MKINPSTPPKEKTGASGVHAEPSHLLHVIFISKPVCHHWLGSNLWGHSQGIKLEKGVQQSWLKTKNTKIHLNCF
jgi:hypothetical protein